VLTLTLLLSQLLQRVAQLDRQVQRIFDQPALVTLLKTYIRMHIPSGNPVDFHKSFVYSLMDRELFARSYLEEVG
jgi:hypothetical protein